MLSIQIKSIFRNKINIEYVIAIIVIFVFLNIGISLSHLLDYYYDAKMKEVIDEESLYYARSLYIPNPEVALTDNQQEEIKKIKYVEDFKIDTIEIPNQTFSCFVIIVDDWKHCGYVKKLFDKHGIELLSSGGSLQYEAILQSYETVMNVSKIIKYLDILITFCIMILIYDNILRNQRDSLRLLKVIGYNSSRIRKITYINLLVLTLVGWIVGLIILIILLFSINLINIEINIIDNIIINVLIYTFAIIISTTSKIRYNKLVT